MRATTRGMARPDRTAGSTAQPSLSVALAVLTCSATALGFMFVSVACQHWFVIPVTLCGMIMAVDAFDWLRGKVDVLDPVGILGLYGVHFFFLAPMLHVYWDWWGRYWHDPPADWRGYLGGMGVLNLLGLSLYRSVVRRSERARSTAPMRTYWHLEWSRFWRVAPLALLACGGLQLFVYHAFGGVSGYIATYESTFAGQLEVQGFRGLGVVFMLSERFPIVAIMAFAVYTRGKRHLTTWPVLTLAMLSCLLLALVFGGLRGSRSNTLWALFWAMGVIHLWVRPFPRGGLILVMGGMIVFAHLYGFYKAGGRDVFEHGYTSASTCLPDRDAPLVLLGDLGRSNAQAMLLYRLLSPYGDYQYALGRTYIGALALLVPRQVWPDRPHTKIRETTEAECGRGSFVYGPGGTVNSRVFGLAGETMLNFGPLAVPFAFLPWGALVVAVRRWGRLECSDTRLLLVPFLVGLCISVLNSDSDNLVFGLVTNGLVPFVVIRLSSRICPRFLSSRHGGKPANASDHCLLESGRGDTKWKCYTP